MELGVQIKKDLFIKELIFFHQFQSFVTGLSGASGAGKTTILRAIAGIGRISEGKIIYNGTTWVDTEKNIYLPVYQRNVVFLMQEPDLFPNMNARENICFSQRTRWKKKSKKKPMRIILITYFLG